MRSGKFCSLLWFANCDYRNLSAHFLTDPANSKSSLFVLIMGKLPFSIGRDALGAFVNFYTKRQPI